MKAEDKFDAWFYQTENYHLLAERFYEDLDAIRDKMYATNKAGNVQIANWLKAAFEAGYDAAIEGLKNKTVSEHSDKYSDIVSDGGMDPR